MILKNRFDFGVVEISLNRPELHNAFNEELIASLTQTFQELDADKSVRLVILTGMGTSFCAGADLNWMKKMKDYSFEQNVEDSQKLANMFATINAFSKPVIGKINGHALGGGVGLVSSCDYVITTEDALFGLTEVRLGLVPAVISPYVMAKIGESYSRAYFMSGEKFSAQRAKEIGLVHEVVTASELNEKTQKLIKSFLMAGPEAAQVAKKLVFKNKELKESVQQYTCETIANARISSEGQEGMDAMLSKRKAKWIVS